MSSKKGFTIVELAIVLVVIGIILAMVVKGKQLVESARNKAELAKITKLEAATAIYFTYVNGSITEMTVYPPGLVEGMTNLNIDHMESLGIVTLGELKSRYRDRNKDAYWMGFLCAKEVRNNERYWRLSGPGAREDLNICAVLALEENVVVRFGVGSSNKRMICLTETFLDDENLHSGNAMIVYDNMVSLTITPPEYKDCQALPDTNVSFLYHAYKLF